MKKVTTLSALAVLLGIGVYDTSFRDDDRAEGVTGDQNTPGRSAELAEVIRERAPLSRAEILDRLPEQLPLIGGVGLQEEQLERMMIFEKLGAMDGEEAVDYIFERYGKGQTAYLPMTFAMRGWMEKDMEAALAAVKGFMKNGKGGFAQSFHSMGLFEWKGERFHSGLS